MVFQTMYGEREVVGVDTGLKTPVKQEFKDDTDVNNIVERFLRTGELSNMIQQDPIYGDFVDVPTYEEAFNIVLFANEQFDALPSNLRERFFNSPAKFLEFCSNPDNRDEMVKLGLMVDKKDTSTININNDNELNENDEGVKK